MARRSTVIARDHARLRGEQQRLARVADLERDVLRHHPLQVLLRVGPRDANEVAGSPGDACEGYRRHQTIVGARACVALAPR